MILDFGSFPRRGLLADLEYPAEIWGGTYLRQSRGSKAGEELAEDRKATDLPEVRVRDPKTQPHRRRYQ